MYFTPPDKGELNNSHFKYLSEVIVTPLLSVNTNFYQKHNAPHWRKAIFDNKRTMPVYFVLTKDTQ
jgi:hypothetical protein